MFSFFNFLLVGGRIRIRTNDNGSGSETPKNLRGLRIRNTDYPKHMITIDYAFFLPNLTIIFINKDTYKQ
jgi:hypothetical protein